MIICTVKTPKAQSQSPIPICGIGLFESSVLFHTDWDQYIIFEMVMLENECVGVWIRVLLASIVLQKHSFKISDSFVSWHMDFPIIKTLIPLHMGEKIIVTYSFCIRSCIKFPTAILLFDCAVATISNLWWFLIKDSGALIIYFDFFPANTSISEDLSLLTCKTRIRGTFIDLHQLYHPK